MSYTHLSGEERGKIEAWLFEGVAQSEIANRLGRHRSTISREIRRNSEKRKGNSIAALPYQASSANNLANLRKANCGSTTKVARYNIKTIKKYLELKWSPDQIANAVKSVTVCRNTIYNWMYSKIIDFDIKKLRHKGKRYKRKCKGRALQRPDSTFYINHSIEDRPLGCIDRSEFGHWEADTIISKRGVASCLATFVERKTRLYVAIKIPKKNSVSMLSAIKTLVDRFPKGAVKSITCDRGAEFVHQFNIGLVEDTFGVKIYYANPYSPQKRGSNE
ncbi:IS30 family transposase [Vagococcus elongatus]|uniref:IS30 family transposase n=1 Tax=Vagococcus elongatus TaxID=180344 RepID=UPI001FEA4C81|nr:IS30 family transposase [Vagococcus elongatus]